MQSGCGLWKGAGSGGRGGEEATQGLSVSWGLIGGWPDESELGARPSPLAPARAAGSAPPRSRFVPAEGGRGCGEERAGGREPGTRGPRDREAGRAAHCPTPRPAGTAPAPTRSHRPAGEQAAPRPQSPAPRTPEPPPQPLPAHRGRPAGRLCNRTGPLAPAPCPVGAAHCARAVREDAAGGGRASAVGFRGWAGGAAAAEGGTGVCSSRQPPRRPAVLCGGGSPLKRARVSESPCPFLVAQGSPFQEQQQVHK